MAYKHILVAVDLSDESSVLIEKAISVAKPYNAKISIIHVDVNYSDFYTGLMDLHIGDVQRRVSDETQQVLFKLSEHVDYPITELLTAKGDLSQVLIDVVDKYGVDLLLCGHHQDFWSKLVSSARQLINTIHIDTLIIPLSAEPGDDS